MTPPLASLADGLTQAALLALLLERTLSLLFAPPHAIQSSRRLPATLHFRLPIRHRPEVDLPLFETGCLVAAFWLSAALPVATLLPNHWPSTLSSALSALFITGLASGLRGLIYGSPTAAGQKSPAPKTQEMRASGRTIHPSRLARLFIKPENHT